MNKSILLFIVFLIVELSFSVFAELGDIPPAPEDEVPPINEIRAIPPAPEDKEYSEKIVKCIDSDGGINYYERGVISYKVIKWEAPETHIPPEGGQMDSCVEAPKDHSYYGKVTQVFIREVYCESPDDVNVKYKDYDCSTERKICHDGACIEETEEIKQLHEKREQKREQIMSFWSRIFYFFMNPSGKASFSKTIGEVRDSEGNTIEGVKVRMNSFCSSGHFVGDSHIQETITDNNGKFEFDSFNIKSVLPSRKCKKVISVYKEGYCGYSNSIHYATCLRAVQESGEDFSEIDVNYISDSNTIKAKEEHVSLVLKKVNFETISEELEELEKELSKRPLAIPPKE